MRCIAILFLGMLLTLSGRADGQVVFEIQAHHTVKNGDLGELDLSGGGIAGTGNILGVIAIPVNEKGNINAILITGYNNYGTGSRSLSDELSPIDVSGIAEGADEIIEGAGEIVEGVGDFLEGVASSIDREYGRQGIPVLGGVRVCDGDKRYFFQAAVGIEAKRSEMSILVVDETETEVDVIGSVGAGAFFWRGLGATASYNVSQGSWRYMNVGLVYRGG